MDEFQIFFSFIILTLTITGGSNTCISMESMSRKRLRARVNSSREKRRLSGRRRRQQDSTISSSGCTGHKSVRVGKTAQIRLRRMKKMIGNITQQQGFTERYSVISGREIIRKRVMMLISILAIILISFTTLTIFLTILLCWCLIAVSQARHRRNPYEYPETLL